MYRCLRRDWIGLPRFSSRLDSLLAASIRASQNLFTSFIEIALSVILVILSISLDPLLPTLLPPIPSPRREDRPDNPNQPRPNDEKV